MAEARRQLPPQIKRIELAARKGGRPVVRYQLTVDVGEVDGKRKRMRKRYSTEAEARRVLDEVRGQVSGRTYVHPTTLTVEQACADWLLSRHGIEPTTRSGYRDALQPVRSELGEVPVQKLTRKDIDTLVRRLRDGDVLRPGGKKRKPWSARYCNLMLGTLSQVLEQLVAEGDLARNVARHVDRVPGKPTKFETYEPEQVAAVLDSLADDRDRHAWHLALTGLRRGEIGGLKWAHIDLKAKTLQIADTRVSANGKAIDQEGVTKSASSSRPLPIPDGLLAELKAAKRRQAAEKLALGAAYADLGYVVCNEAGEPYHPDTLTKMWTKAVAKAGVPHIRLHDARHTCATTMHLQGVPIGVVAAWLGHADSSFTMRTYVKSQPEALRAAAQSLSRVVTIRHNSDPI
jgi:integrase